MPETVDLQGFEGICPRGEKKPIGYLIFLSPLFFFFWGQIWGQNERNPESMGISGIFHLSPYFEDGDKRSEKPHFTGVFKGSILSPIFLFWGQTGTKFSFLSVPPPILLSPYFPQRQMPGTNLSPDFKGLFVSDFLSPGTKRDLTVYFLHIG